MQLLKAHVLSYYGRSPKQEDALDQWEEFSRTGSAAIASKRQQLKVCYLID